MKVTMSRDIYKHGKVSSAYLMIILAVVGLVFSILLIWVLEKDILSRVRWLDFQVSDIGRTGDLSRRISIKGKDELMELAAAINRMIKQVQDSQRELQVANESLRQLDIMKSDFLSMVSHELRTPLTAILGFTQLIEDKMTIIKPAVSEETGKVGKVLLQVEENCRIISSEALRLTGMINDLLDLAQLESGQIYMRREEVNVGEIIEQAVQAVSALLDEKGLAVKTEIAADLPSLTGAKDRLVQVMINLISNAIKFTPRGSITCEACRVGHEVWVSVQDTGIGIAREDQDMIFERFKQVGGALANRPAGTGLGLAICKQIIEYHGGKIWVESEPDKGSRFTFSLPIDFGQGTRVDAD
jgi:signal transduction histidine kinase